MPWFWALPTYETKDKYPDWDGDFETEPKIKQILDLQDVHF